MTSLSEQGEVMRIQVYFHEADGQRNGFDVYEVGGVVEVERHEARAFDSRLVSMRFHFGADGSPELALFLRDPRTPEIGPRVRQVAFEDIPGSSFLLRTPDTFRNAEVIVRRTDLPPSRHGAEVCAFSGVAFVPETVASPAGSVWQLSSAHQTDAVAVFLEGAVGRDVRPECGDIDPELEIAMAGFAAPFSRAWWGFGPDAAAVEQRTPFAAPDDREARMPEHDGASRPMF